MITKVAVVLSAINGLILLSLIYVYAQNYRRLSSQFSLGLLIFAGFLLIENLLAFYFNLTMMGLYIDKVAFQAFILRMFQTAALLVLGSITWRN
jgi:hypothetical protein